VWCGFIQKPHSSIWGSDERGQLSDPDGCAAEQGREVPTQVLTAEEVTAVWLGLGLLRPGLGGRDWLRPPLVLKRAFGAAGGGLLRRRDGAVDLAVIEACGPRRAGEVAERGRVPCRGRAAGGPVQTCVPVALGLSGDPCGQVADVA
jgi:hypothetical protein